MRASFLNLLRSAALVGLALTASAAAQDPIPVSVDDQFVYAEPGAVAGVAVSVPVRVGADLTGRGVRAVDVVVRFDPAVVSLTSATLSGLVPPGCATASGTGPGEINVRVACSSSTPLAGGPGTLVTFQGTLVGEGTSAVTFADTTPFNEGQVAAATSDGSIKVVTDPDPNIGAIEDQTVEEDGTATVQFTLSDQDTPLESVTVSAQSSSAVVASGGLAVGTCEGEDASSACRVLRITPAPDASGTATITLTASDGDARSEDTATSFALTVTPVNDAPTVAAGVEDRSEPAGSAPVQIDLAGVFADVDDATLQYSATSSAPETATVSVDGATATVTPVQFGTATITLRATDGSGLSAEDTFVLTVLTGVPTEPGAPAAFAVHGSTPNPASASAAVVLDLPAASAVRVEVYDTAGRQVIDADAGVLAAGAGRRVPLDLGTLSAGVYVYRVTARLGSSTRSASGQLVVVR